ncbi:MAG: phosphotransferase [Acidimicrobiales bacterium]|nr:phosphotransferase [Acidimicrobiales bacterium]
MAPYEPVVLHGDLGLNNVSIDPETGALLGVFDFGQACVGDPHLDLRYDPIYEAGGPGMRPSYEAARGVALIPERVAFFHALSALHNLSISIDHEPPELLAIRQGWVDAVAAWDPATYSPP